MFARITLGQWSVFWRKLENLLSGGMPLMQSLDLLKANHSDSLANQIESIQKNLRSGLAFYESIPSNFLLWRGILLAGERSGHLSEAVGRLADKLESDLALRSEISSALVYPLMVVVMCLVVVFLLASLVVPRFQQLFRTLDIKGELPALTVAIFNFSQFLQQWGLLSLAVLALLVLFLFFQRQRWGKFFESVLKRIPFFGSLYSQQIGLDIIDNFSMLLGGGLSLDQSLGALSEASGSPSARASLQQAYARIREGDSLTVALGRVDFWEATDIELLAIAQRSGTLGQTSARLSKLQRDRFMRRSALAVRLIEPLLIALMALLVGILLVGLFSPLMPLIGRLSDGTV